MRACRSAKKTPAKLFHFPSPVEINLHSSSRRDALDLPFILSDGVSRAVVVVLPTHCCCVFVVRLSVALSLCVMLHAASIYIRAYLLWCEVLQRRSVRWSWNGRHFFTEPLFLL